MNIYDTLSKQVKPLDQSKIIKWYMCGPTVYDHSHIGHARNYITNDILVRILQYNGYRVCLTMNITDVDDKIINKAVETNTFWKVISETYEKSFMEDMKKLNVNSPHLLTRVSDYMNEIINFIEDLVEKEYAYKSLTGSVYFDSEKYYQDYTDGFDVPVCDLCEEVCDTTFLSEKKDPRDFALWKNAKPNEPAWQSPFGQGRPGWHIECSAMSNSVFGEELTIHSGGIDLKFPHHENERKQCVGRSGNTNWVETFIHIGHLHIEGLKMSKSLKNFITIKNILNKYSSNDLRMFCLMHKYSDNVDYSEQHLDQVVGIMKLFADFISRTNPSILLSDNILNKQDPELVLGFVQIQKEIDDRLRDDFDTPSMIKLLIVLVKVANNNNTNNYIVIQIRKYILEILSMVGIVFEQNDNNNNEITDKLLKLLKNFRDDVRNYAKTNKQPELFAVTDELRKRMVNCNISLTDQS